MDGRHGKGESAVIFKPKLTCRGDEGRRNMSGWSSRSAPKSNRIIPSPGLLVHTPITAHQTGTRGSSLSKSCSLAHGQNPSYRNYKQNSTIYTIHLFRPISTKKHSPSCRSIYLIDTEVLSDLLEHLGCVVLELEGPAKLVGGRHQVASGSRRGEGVLVHLLRWW